MKFRRHTNTYLMAKALLALLCSLVAIVASAFPMIEINRHITCFADIQGGVIKLVIDTSHALPARQSFFIGGNSIDIVRPDSAWEYQRPHSAGRVELILRRVPENDNQVVIDFNGNSRIEQQAGILLEVAGLEATMGFDSVLNLMVAPDITNDQIAGRLPHFSFLNALASDLVNQLILGNLDSQSAAVHPERIIVPDQLSLGAITSFPGLGYNFIAASALSTGSDPGAPNILLSVIAQPARPGYFMIQPSGSERSLSIPVLSVGTVTVNPEYVSRERLDDIIRRGNGQHETLPEAHSSLRPVFSRAAAYSQLFQQGEDAIRARNLFYSNFLFPGPSLLR